MLAPHLDVTVKYEEPLDDLREIARAIRPGWDLSKLAYEDKSTGYINRNLKVYIPEENDAFILRMGMPHFHPLYFEGQRKIYRFMDEQGLGPTLLCTIQNGLCVEFLKGEFMTWNAMDRMYDDDVYPRTAEVMAKYHCKAVYESARALPVKDSTDLHQFRQVVLPIVEGYYATAPDSEFKRSLPQPEQIYQELDYAIRTLAKVSPEMRFTHMDGNPTNWSIGETETVLIDYDATSTFFVSVDLAWFFLTHCNFLRLTQTDTALPEGYPSPEYRRKWLRIYLTKRRQLDSDLNPVTFQDVEALLRDIDDHGMLYAYLQGLYAGLIILSQSTKTGDDQFSPMSVTTFWNNYKLLKEKLSNKDTFSPSKLFHNIA